MRSASVLRGSLALALVASSVRAFAQPAGAQAEVLFRQGRELMAAGKLAEACAAFEESQKLEAATTTLLNLANCRELNGQLATAWGLFLDAMRQTRGASDDATQKLHDAAKNHADKLEPRVSKLTIKVPAEDQNGRLEILRNTDQAMSRGLLNSVTVRMISSWPSLVMQTLVAGS
jgi:tetratricopeptide (TPR) repeat protein